MARLLWGEEGTAGRFGRKTALFLAGPAIGAVVVVGMGLAGSHRFPLVAVALALAWASLDWVIRRFLAKGAERTVLRPALLASVVGGGAVSAFADALIPALIALAALTTTFVGLRLHHARLAEGDIEQEAPGPNIPPMVLRMVEHWRWFSLQLWLTRSELRYVGEEGGEDRLLLTVSARANPDRLRSALRAAPQRLDVLLKLPGGSCRLQPEPDQADRYHLFVRRPDDERRFERLLGTPAGAREPEPTPDERLEALLAANPSMSNAEVVAAMAGVMSRRAVYERLRLRGLTRPYAQRGSSNGEEAV